MQELKKTQRIASYLVVGTIMWEFFSYYGMQAILILYLTQALHFTDQQAYAIYGSFTSLIYMTPILGGWLADRYCGYRYAALWGSVFIILGHLTLTFSVQGLYPGLAFLILGIGLFKSNTICLIGECYPGDQPGRSAAFAWYYVSGNLGAVASQVLCPYFAQRFGWHYGFILAAIGMLFGLILLIAARHYFKWYHAHLRTTKWTALSPISQFFIALVLSAISFGMVNLVLRKLWVGNLLVAVCIVAIVMCVNIFKNADQDKRKSLTLIGCLALFAMGFWIFDQQGSSSVSLFIARFIDRKIDHVIIPAGSFQAINPGIILVFGAALAWVWRALDKRHINPSAISKVSAGLLLLTVGFLIISVAGSIANVHGVAPMLFPIAGLVLIGAAEMFIDPVMLATITNAAPPQTEGRLIAVYYLLTGAIANYVAAKVANLTIDPTTDSATALTYHQAYVQIMVIGLVMFGVLLVWSRMKLLKL